MNIELLKPKEVAERLGISRSQAYVLIRDGLIPNLRFGRCFRVRPEDLEEFIELNNISGILSVPIKNKLAARTASSTNEVTQSNRGHHVSL
jgi:excisionase family DNA binding protein